MNEVTILSRDGSATKRVAVPPEVFAAVVAHTLELGWSGGVCRVLHPLGYVCTREGKHDGMHVASYYSTTLCPNLTEDGPVVWE